MIPMRRLSGVALVLAGLSVAAYALAGPEMPLGAATSGPAANGAMSAVDPRTSSALPPGSVAAELRPLADSAGKAALTPPQPRALRKNDTARGVVLVRGSTRTPIGQPIPGSGLPHDRASLTRDLQRQLQRVGCYKGGISGIWSPSTRQAMKEFIDRVNATLPVHEPDHILLAMLQGYQEEACGQGCRSDQTLSDNGRCPPNAILARDPSRKNPETRALAAHQVPAAAAESVVGPQQPMAGRMSLAGPEAGTVPPPTATQAVGPKPRHARDASRLRTRKAGSPKYASNRKRPMGAWIFHDAPVDRLLAR